MDTSEAGTRTIIINQAILMNTSSTGTPTTPIINQSILMDTSEAGTYTIITNQSINLNGYI